MTLCPDNEIIRRRIVKSVPETMKLPDSGYGSVLPGGKAFKKMSVPPAQWPVLPKDIEKQRALDGHFANVR